MKFSGLLGLLAFLFTQGDAATLDGRQIKVTTIVAPPFIIKNNASVASWRGEYEGILIDVLQELASMANFTYVIEHVRDFTYGRKTKSGAWTGMIGEVISNVADIAIAPLTMTSNRAYHVSFSQPILDAGLQILIKKSPPQDQHQSLNLILSPFTTGLWFIIIGCFVVASLVFFAIGRLSPYEQREEAKSTDEVPMTRTLTNSVLYSTSSFFHQGMAPKSSSGRVFSLFWWVFSALAITTFAANFTAILLSKSPDIRYAPFTTFDELSRQSDVQYSTVRYGSTFMYFKNSTRSMEKRIYQQMNANPNVLVNNYNEAVAKVRSSNGKYAFIGEGHSLRYMTTKAPCDTMVVGNLLNDKVYGFVCSQNSDLCSLLNPYILRLTWRNFLKETVAKYMRSEECSGSKNRAVKMRTNPVVDGFKKLGIRMETQMSFDRFSAAFFILIGGCLLCLVTLGGEILYVNKFGPP